MTGWLAWGSVSAFVVGATAWVAAQPDARTYPVPLTTARERLATTPLPPEMLVVGTGAARLERRADGLVWELGDPSDPLVLTAGLAANGASTDVTLDLSMPRASPHGFRMLGTQLTEEVARSALEEHVDAVLTGRPYRQLGVAQRLAPRLERNPETLEKFGDAVRDDVIALHKQAIETAKAADSDGGPAIRSHTGLSPDPATYQPMTPLE